MVDKATVAKGLYQSAGLARPSELRGDWSAGFGLLEGDEIPRCFSEWRRWSGFGLL